MATSIQVQKIFYGCPVSTWISASGNDTFVAVLISGSVDQRVGLPTSRSVVDSIAFTAGFLPSAFESSSLASSLTENSDVSGLTRLY